MLQFVIWVFTEMPPEIPHPTLFVTTSGDLQGRCLPCSGPGSKFNNIAICAAPTIVMFHSGRTVLNQGKIIPGFKALISEIEPGLKRRDLQPLALYPCACHIFFNEHDPI